MSKDFRGADVNQIRYDDDDDDDLLGLAARGWITTHTYIHAVKEN